MDFFSFEGYLNPLNPYFGATVGRVANRIGYSKIIIDGRQFNVSANLGEHQLHGGFRGFDKVLNLFELSSRTSKREACFR